MTVTPFAAPTAPTATVPILAETSTAAPADFLAAFIAAMSDAETLPSLVEEGALADPPLVEEGALAPVSKPGERLPEPASDSPAVDPNLAALAGLVLQTPVLAPRLDRLDVRTADAEPTEVSPIDVTTPEPAVAGKAATTKERVSVPAEIPSSSNPVSTLPATAIQPSSPQPPAPVAAAAPVAAPVAHTSPLDRVSAQVFPEVTGLVSRGNGTHRITMTLNPEQLGEVRVVMTVRDGVVHVRMAAGHETRAALLDGSPELSRLLESTGATETRIVVRDLPAAPITPTNPSSDPNNGSLDQHAGTRADHQAKDGSDQNTPRPTRAEGTTSPGLAPRSIHPVIDTRTAGVDLTM